MRTLPIIEIAAMANNFKLNGHLYSVLHLTFWELGKKSFSRVRLLIWSKKGKHIYQLGIVSKLRF